MNLFEVGRTRQSLQEMALCRVTRPKARTLAPCLSSKAWNMLL